LDDEHGFTLVEVLVAMAIVVITAVGVAELVTIAARASMTSRRLTTSTSLAVQKMEQLEALMWTFADEEPGAGPVADVSTDLSVDPPVAGGAGLATSPAGALDHNTAGYVDYLDANGAWIGTGTTQPSAAVFVRRWSIEPLPAEPDHTLVLQVLVTSAATDRSASLLPDGRRAVLAGDALLATIHTRRRP